MKLSADYSDVPVQTEQGPWVVVAWNQDPDTRKWTQEDFDETAQIVSGPYKDKDLAENFAGEIIEREGGLYVEVWTEAEARESGLE